MNVGTQEYTALSFATLLLTARPERDAAGAICTDQIAGTPSTSRRAAVQESPSTRR
jgi:hypothetical protein